MSIPPGRTGREWKQQHGLKEAPRRGDHTRRMGESHLRSALSTGSVDGITKEGKQWTEAAGEEGRCCLGAQATYTTAPASAAAPYLPQGLSQKGPSHHTVDRVQGTAEDEQESWKSAASLNCGVCSRSRLMSMHACMHAIRTCTCTAVCAHVDLSILEVFGTATRGRAGTWSGGLLDARQVLANTSPPCAS